MIRAVGESSAITNDDLSATAYSFVDAEFRVDLAISGHLIPRNRYCISIAKSGHVNVAFNPIYWKEYIGRKRTCNRNILLQVYTQLHQSVSHAS